MASSAELERRAEHARQRLTGRLADLRYHVSPSTVASDLLGIDIETIGKDVLALTRQVRSNPVAYGLIAAGIGWLIFSDFARPAAKALSVGGKRRRAKRAARKTAAKRHQA
ncbi:MAG TPA: hypothetical protein VKG24_27165 [Pseudolabrys sp.]|jgi:hypothetical protein|nr:hypothetical protein [Pseudolabrys sp.]